MATKKNPTAAATTVTLTLREHEIVQYIAKYIHPLNKNMLVGALTHVVKKLSRLNVNYSEQCAPGYVSSMKDAISHASNLSVLKKGRLEDVYASFTGYIGNYIELARVDSHYAATLRDVLLNPMSTFGDVLRTMDGEVNFPHDVMWATLRVLADAAFNLNVIPTVQTYAFGGASVNRMILPVDERYRRILLFGLYGADTVEPHLTESLPVDNDLVVLNYEADTQNDLARLDAMRAAGLFPPDKSLTRNRVNSLAGRAGADEFPEEAGGSCDGCVQRGQLEVFAYSLYNDYCGREGNDHPVTGADAFTRFIADGLAQNMVSTDYTILLPAFSGFTKVWTEYSHTRDVVDRLHAYVAQSGTGKWLTTDNMAVCYLIAGAVLDREIDRPKIILFDEEGRRKNKLRPAGEHEYYGVHHDFSVDWWKDITLPFVVHWLKLLCAVGMLEIAVSRRAAATEPMEGIRHIRLTPLGRYAFGLSDTFVPVTNKPEDWSYELDSDGVISSFGEMPPYDDLLAKIGRRVSANRFVVTARSIVAGSADADDVARNVNSFRTIFKPEPGSRWDVMLNETLQRCNCMDSVSGQYALIKLKTDVPGLVSAVLSDPEICSNCIKAEQGVLIVPTAFYPRLRRILQLHGYML